jgi:moderate conductance mechanosensitive channel
MADLVFNVTPPWGGDALQLGPYVRPTLAIIGILVATLILIRMTHLFVRGILRALRNHATPEGGVEELTAAEIARRQDTIESLIVNVVRFFVVGIAILMILETAFDLDIGPAIAGLGIVGIAVGLGTQNLVRDYLNGALILIENQYSIGDVVMVAGISGTVEDFTLRRTTVRDVDGTVHTVPNGQISIASNMTRSWSRVHLDVRVAYGTDVEKTVRLVDDLGRKLAEDADWREHVTEAPHVERVSEFGDLGFTILVLGKVAAGQQWAVGGEMRKRLLAEFERRGIQIPTLTVAPGKARR